MGFSTQKTTTTTLRPFCPSSFWNSRSCRRSFRVASSSRPFMAPSEAHYSRIRRSYGSSKYKPTNFPTSRRKILSVQVANNGLQNSAVSCNTLQLREGSLQFQSRIVIGMRKYNGMEYNRNLYKTPIHVSFMKFSTASTGMLEEVTEEEELNSSHYYEAKVQKVSIFARDRGTASVAAKGELFGDRRGWVRARDNLTVTKVQNKLGCNNGSTYASKIYISNGQEQVRSKDGGPGPLLLQDQDVLISSPSVSHSKSKNTKVLMDSKRVGSQSIESHLVISKDETSDINENHNLEASRKHADIASLSRKEYVTGDLKLRVRLCSIYKDILVVDNISLAKEVVGMLTKKYRHLIHACDTEVAKIDVKVETPVDHGEIVCFSIYSGPEADFGNGKSCIWVDVLDGGGKEMLFEFEPFFKDHSIKKVWHNYSFDNHVIENYRLKVSGFHADTMHMARLWNSSRRLDGGYSLEALTSDKRVMCGAHLNHEKDLIGKVSMKTIFGRRKVKKDGSEGKMITIPPVEVLQRDERIPWICYSALDARSTLKLYESLKSHLSKMLWKVDGVQMMGPASEKTMYDFYEEYWRPFGELLVQMESEGMLVDRAYLAAIEKVATAEQEVAVNRFRKWASRYCPDAKYMNVGSDAQLRQLLFGGMVNSKDPSLELPIERTFKVPNVDRVIKEGQKAPSKFRDIKLHSIGCQLQTEMYTETGWPSVSGDALKTLAGNASAEYDFIDEACNLDCGDEYENSSQDEVTRVEKDNTAYGTAFSAFATKDEGREACHAIAALCEVCSIDSLISNFILPLQGNNVSGRNGRIHCSLNINTETGRLSARRPNLQNQPALEKDRYKIRQAFIAAPGNSLIVADYGQLELRILAHLASCKSMLEAFKAGGDFHSRTAMNMYPHIREAIEKKQVILEWHPQPGEDKPPVPLLKDAFASERRKAKMLNFSIAYGKTPVGLARDWKVSVKEARETVKLWYNDRKEVLAWQGQRKNEACEHHCVHTVLGRARRFPLMAKATSSQKSHIERAAINTPVQGSAADVAMCAMLQISKNTRLKELGWKLLLQVHDEVILEGPTESAEIAKAIVVDCMSKPFDGKNILQVDLAVDAKCAQNWYSAK